MRPDPTGRANGRGAYLCRQARCWEKGAARRALERSLRRPVADDDLEKLIQYFVTTIASGGMNTAAGPVGAAAPGAAR